MKTPGSRPPRAAIFLDRDGVLTPESGEFITHPDMVTLLPGSADAVARISAAGWPTIVFTNQSGVGRGLMRPEMLTRVHDRLLELIRSAGGTLAAIYACPHAPDERCGCRKPRPGLLFEAADAHDLDLAQCYAIGDSPRDVSAGRAAGCRTVLVLSGSTRSYEPESFPDAAPDEVFADLGRFADSLLARD